MTERMPAAEAAARHRGFVAAITDTPNRIPPYEESTMPDREKPETEMLTWCATRNGYADVDECGPGHVHYGVEVEEATGKVLTDAAEQARRREQAETRNRLRAEVEERRQQIEDLEAERDRTIAAEREQAAIDVRAAIQSVRNAQRTIERLRSNEVYDVEYAESTEGSAVLVLLANAETALIGASALAAQIAR